MGFKYHSRPEGPHLGLWAPFIHVLAFSPHPLLSSCDHSFRQTREALSYRAAKGQGNRWPEAEPTPSEPTINFWSGGLDQPRFPQDPEQCGGPVCLIALDQSVTRVLLVFLGGSLASICSSFSGLYLNLRKGVKKKKREREI